MKERAKQILLELKEENEELSKSFDAYVKKLCEDLELDESIAITLVTDELVNRYYKKLILKDLFSKYSLDKLNKK